MASAPRPARREARWCARRERAAVPLARRATPVPCARGRRLCDLCERYARSGVVLEPAVVCAVLVLQLCERRRCETQAELIARGTRMTRIASPQCIA